MFLFRRMPSGCAEQTFKSFIPNIVAMKYLDAIGKLTASYKKKGESYLTHGYQELLKIRLDDGSFSLWGEEDAASVWLTAYIAKILGHTRHYMALDDKDIVKALDFVKEHQNEQFGNFSDENAYDFIYKTETESQRGMALTAFIAIAFLENTHHVKAYKGTIDKAMAYLSANVVSLKDSVSMAMAAYAFALHKNKNETKKIFPELENLAIQGESTMYWDNGSPSVQVETAAYAIMAYVEVGEAYKAMPIVNWLVSQRQASGGFYATADTVIGVQALALYATTVHAPQKNVKITLSYERKRHVEFEVDAKNALVLQAKGIKSDARRFSLNAIGDGYAYFQLSSSYSVNLEDPQKSFEIRADLLPTNDNVLHLKICASFIANGTQTQSGMTVIEVYLPSGYEYDKETEKHTQKVGVKVD